MSGNAAMKFPIKREIKLRFNLFFSHLGAACIQVKDAFSVLAFGSYEARVKASYDDLKSKLDSGEFSVGSITAKEITPGTLDVSKLSALTIAATPTDITVSAPAPWGISGPVGDTVVFDPSKYKDCKFEFGGYGYVDPPAAEVKKIKVKTKKKAKTEKKAKADKKKAKKKKS